MWKDVGVIELIRVCTSQVDRKNPFEVTAAIDESLSTNFKVLIEKDENDSSLWKITMVDLKERED